MLHVKSNLVTSHGSFTLDHKNYLFYKPVNDAKANAIIYRTVETAKDNELNVYILLFNQFLISFINCLVLAFAPFSFKCSSVL